MKQAQDASWPGPWALLYRLSPLPATLAPAFSCLKVGDSPITLPRHLALPASRMQSKSLLLALAAFSTGLTHLSWRPASHSLPLSSCGTHSEASPATCLDHACLQQLCSHSCLYPPRPPTTAPSAQQGLSHPLRPALRHLFQEALPDHTHGSETT